jgi:hypothetical protein
LRCDTTAARAPGLTGAQIKERTRLNHFDRLCFGADTLFFVDMRLPCVSAPLAAMVCV